jgi:hypothetical protein
MTLPSGRYSTANSSRGRWLAGLMPILPVWPTRYRALTLWTVIAATGGQELALKGPSTYACQCLLIGHDRTCRGRALTAEFDPSRTCVLLDELTDRATKFHFRR